MVAIDVASRNGLPSLNSVQRHTTNTVWDRSTMLSKAMLVSLFGRVKRAVSADRPAHTVSGYSAAAGFSAAAAAGAAVVLLLSGTAGVAGLAAGAGAGLGLGAAGGLTAG